MGRCSITPCLITYRRVNQIDGLTNWNGYSIPCIGKWRHVTRNSAFCITFLHVFFRNFWGSLQFMQDLLGYCVMESESNRYTGYTGHWIYIVAFVWLLRANGQHVHHSVFMMSARRCHQLASMVTESSRFLCRIPLAHIPKRSQFERYELPPTPKYPILPGWLVFIWVS
jgi:hypothetical protein